MISEPPDKMVLLVNELDTDYEGSGLDIYDMEMNESEWLKWMSDIERETREMIEANKKKRAEDRRMRRFKAMPFPDDIWQHIYAHPPGQAPREQTAQQGNPTASGKRSHHVPIEGSGKARLQVLAADLLRISMELRGLVGEPKDNTDGSDKKEGQS